MTDLKAQYSSIKPEIDEAIARVVDSQIFILGNEAYSIELEVAQYCGCRFGVAVSSGTDALLAALMAIGVGMGDEVITTPYSFSSTATTIARLGARPVFVDIREGEYNIDPALIEIAITPNTVAIVPVHVAGCPADMPAIMEIAKRHNLRVIEDACQAIGAKIGDRFAGTFGDMGCFSFYPTKNLGAYGDAGMIITNDPILESRLRMIRNHGQRPKYYNRVIGGNFRMDEIQAAILRVKLKHLDEWIEKRIRNANLYTDIFKKLNTNITLPHVPDRYRHTFHLYMIQTNKREQTHMELVGNGVFAEVYYPLPLHLQECMRYLNYERGYFPVSERTSRRSIALPVYPELSTEQIGIIAEIVNDSF